MNLRILQLLLYCISLLLRELDCMYLVWWIIQPLLHRLYVALFVGNMFTTAMKTHSIVPEAIFSHRTTPVALISDLLH